MLLQLDVFVEEINEVIFQYYGIIPFLYSLIFVASIGVYKCATSLTITSVVLALGEYAQEIVKRPLWEFVAESSIEYNYLIMLWVGVWIVASTIMIIILHKLHVWLNVTKSKVAQVVQWVLVVSILLQIIKYLDEILIQSDSILLLYQFGISCINICLIIYMLYSLFRNIFNVDF